MSRFSGVDSGVGRLRAVIVHRPGAELKRVGPGSAGRLLFGGLPWAARAQQEHNAFTQVLRDHGVQVLYLTELLQDVLEYAPGSSAATSTGSTRKRSPGCSSPGSRRASSAAAAAPAGVDRLRVIETGLGPAAAGREPWDDAGNLLVLEPGLVVSHERNVASNARLERCGIEVITVPGSELCGARGGPRSLCCPVSRDPAPLPADLSRNL